MKKSSIVFSIIKNNVFANSIIIFQIFIILFNIIPNLNIIRNNNYFIDIAENTSLKKALYYMNEEIIEYFDKTTNKRKTNLEILQNNKKRINQIAQKNNIVKSISPYRISDGYYVDGITAIYKVYDKETLKTVQSYLSDGKLPETKDIPEIVLLRTKYTKDNKVGDIIELKGDNNTIKVRICGVINDTNISLLNTATTSNMRIPINVLFEKVNVDGERIISFITDNNESIKSLMNEDDYYTFQPQSIIYFNDDVTNEEINEFINILKKENLGYFIKVSDMIDEQKIENSFILNSKTDYFIMLGFIILTALFSISFYLQKKIKKEINIYMLNGANKTEIFSIFLLYYLFVYLLALFIYYVFYISCSLGLFGDSVVFSSILYDFSIDFTALIIISVVILMIFLLISYLPIVMMNKNKYIETTKE